MLQYKDQLIDDHTILNFFQSYKAPISHSTIGLWDNLYYTDGIQLDQSTWRENFWEDEWINDSEIMIAVHEVGHWLGLSHTFEGGCQDGIYGDHVDDTPAVADNRGDGTNGFEKNKDSCPDLVGNDSFSNYMDYTSGDRSTFTPGQVFRMLNTFYNRKHGMIYDYSTNTDFNLCMDEVLPTQKKDPTAFEIATNLFGGFF